MVISCLRKKGNNMALFQNDDSIFNREFLRRCMVRLVSGLILTIVGGCVTAAVMMMFGD